VVAHEHRHHAQSPRFGRRRFENGSTALRKYARTGVPGWSSGDPLDSLRTADGSIGFQYPMGYADSYYTMVFHGRIAVRVHAYGYYPMTDDQRKALREATRTVVSTMKFR